MPFKFFGEKIMFLERRIHFLSSSYASEIKIPKLSNITTIIFHKIHKAHIATGDAKITKATVSLVSAWIANNTKAVINPTHPQLSIGSFFFVTAV